MLLELNDSYRQNGMKINANKTKTRVIGREKEKVNVRIRNETVEQVGSFKYLGCTISNNMSCYQEVKNYIKVNVDICFSEKINTFASAHISHFTSIGTINNKSTAYTNTINNINTTTNANRNGNSNTTINTTIITNTAPQHFQYHCRHHCDNYFYRAFAYGTNLTGILASPFKFLLMLLRIVNADKDAAAWQQHTSTAAECAETQIYLDKINNFSAFQLLRNFIYTHFMIDNKPLNTLLYADDVIILANTEDNLQMAIHRLYQKVKEYNLEISIHKTKTMAFIGKNSRRTKIIINNSGVEQVNAFTYLDCNLSYIHSRDIDNKLAKFQQLSRTIRNTLFKKVRQDTILKFYKTMVIPTLLYGSETWTLNN
ncbi:hypothetical protein ANN_14695 [Periplaneta americana]|uniref:Reverse transcriptase domain-containing protein n=1 Tax=Periplaneta americana TaxID=6978 RepID=A0ABQ8SX15_PERAM|nr:hypothetical protein ANN_14695 [Periplaneta americana]